MKNLIRPHFQQLLKYGLIFMLCIACTSVFAVTLEKRISTGNDDAEQTADGKMDRSSSDIELVFDDGNQTVGLRFDNLGIPNGATIEQAYIQFNVDESNTNAASLEIRGEAVDSATIFTSDYFNISNRRTTSNMISWEPVAWNTVHAQGGDQRTPDLRDVIQEIINRNGWQSGNALAIIITGSGERTAESYEGDQTKAPQLYIEYTISSEPPEPEATPEPEQIETPEAVAVCSDTATAKVYLVGDSTVDSDSGWGDSLIDYLSSGSVVVNEAAGGRSSKSFYEEGLFDIVRANLEEGDYVLIQFGHNDSKSDSKLYTTPGSSPDYEGTYRDYLELYVDETRTTGGIPIIVTSVNRMDFDSEYSLNMTLGEYPAAARKAALDFGAVMLDLEKESAEIFNSLGEEETLSLYSDGSSKTHFPSDKSFRVAKMVADLIGESSSSLRCSLANYNPTTEPEVTPEPESEVSPAPETEVTPDPEPEVTPEPEPEVTPEPEPEVTPAPEEGFIITLQRTVSASAEDIEEEGNGKMDFSSSDLELGSYPNPNDQQTVAIRFTDLSIPSNANITKAYIQFKVDEKSSGNAKIDIYGEYTDDSASFDSTSYNTSDRTKTNLFASWSPAAWDTVGESGEDQRTPDLSDIVQTIVSETGWKSGNALTFIINGSGDGKRVAESYDGDKTGAPQLYIEYTISSETPGAEVTPEPEPEVSSDPEEGFVTTILRTVSASAEDIEEEGNGKMDFSSSDLELGSYPNSNDQQTVAIRFTDLSIPSNANITKAYIQFKVDEKSSGNAKIDIYGEYTDDSASFDSTSYNTSDRTKTNLFASWSPDAWDTVGESGEKQRTPDLSDIVQTIVSETGWKSGNALSFIINGSGDGKRVAESYDGDKTGAPQLYIEYTISS